MTHPVRLAVVASHPIQHFCPLFRELARDQRVQLKVFFASSDGARPYFDPAFGQTIDWGGDLLDGFDHVFLVPDAKTIRDAVGRARISASLAEFDPDVVQVYGYGDALARRTLAWCALHRVPSVMISDSELFAARGRLKQALKRLIVPLVLRLPDGFLSIGDENERYFQRYGVKRSRLHRSPIPIDSPGLDDVLNGRERVREEVRESWDVSPEDLVLLAVGKSIARKRHEDLIEATGLLPSQLRRRVVVTLAGGGERTPFLQQRAEELDVRLLPLGFLPVPKLFRAYMAADVLVHPSEADPHPLAIAEAVYCGLPVIVSDRVGSWGPSDDVQPDVNGRRYPVGEVRDLSRLLRDLLENAHQRSALARGSALIGQDRTLSYSATSYVDGVLTTLGL